jgi:hypothetical protein
MTMASAIMPGVIREMVDVTNGHRAARWPNSARYASTAELLPSASAGGADRYLDVERAGGSYPSTDPAKEGGRLNPDLRSARSKHVFG